MNAPRRLAISNDASFVVKHTELMNVDQIQNIPRFFHVCKKGLVEEQLSFQPIWELAGSPSEDAVNLLFMLVQYIF